MVYGHILTKIIKKGCNKLMRLDRFESQRFSCPETQGEFISPRVPSIKLCPSGTQKNWRRYALIKAQTLNGNDRLNCY